MKKIISVIFAFIALTLVFSACSGDTYADKLEKESKAIKRFIAENGLVILNTYPSDGKFGANEYFQDPNTKIYFRVIDKGDDQRPSKTQRTKVSLRFFDILNMLNQNDTVAHTNIYSVPMDFDYGDQSTYNSSAFTTPKEKLEYQFLSQGCVLPLDYDLGSNAEVSLIIPFENGSTYQQSQYVPYYYGRVIYRFINPWETEDQE